MDIILSVATILGGIAAIWFFWDEIKKICLIKSDKLIKLTKAATGPFYDNEKEIILTKESIIKITESDYGQVGNSIIHLKDGTTINIIENKEKLINLLK